VSDIREQVNNTLHIKPYSSQYKIYIIDQADSLTNQSQNALLKTIEEPPSYGIIILLVANSQNLLATILSRCVKITVNSVAKPLILSYLKDREGLSEYDANIYASFSRGNIGKAMQLYQDESFKEMREFLIDIFDKIISKDTIGLLTAAKKMESYKVISDYMPIFNCPLRHCC
jgi:DNA polymerase-3 subunit delta'